MTGEAGPKMGQFRRQSQALVLTVKPTGAMLSLVNTGKQAVSIVFIIFIVAFNISYW